MLSLRQNLIYIWRQKNVFSLIFEILISWYFLFLYIDFEHRTSSVRRLPQCSILRSSRQYLTTDDSLPLISWYQMRAYRCSTPVRTTRCTSGASRTCHCPLHPKALLTPRPWTGNDPWPASARFPNKSKHKTPMLREIFGNSWIFYSFSFSVYAQAACFQRKHSYRRLLKNKRFNLRKSLRVVHTTNVLVFRVKAIKTGGTKFNEQTFLRTPLNGQRLWCILFGYGSLRVQSTHPISVFSVNGLRRFRC